LRIGEWPVRLRDPLATIGQAEVIADGQVRMDLDIRSIDEGHDVRAVLALDGCYDARRAAALSGVPRSTLYDWARRSLVVPSVSHRREMLWSYADLLSLRILYWLRHDGHLADHSSSATIIQNVSDALDNLQEMDLDLWRGHAAAVSLLVDRTGRIFVGTEHVAPVTRGRDVVSPTLDLLGPFEGVDRRSAPDLRRPGEHLRIVPGKCAGEPHLADSRLTTITLAALTMRGYTIDDLARLYPDESRESLAESVDLERSLGTLDLAA
jgi:uncharacterized protein (DUF433 family)